MTLVEIKRILEDVQNKKLTKIQALEYFEKLKSGMSDGKQSDSRVNLPDQQILTDSDNKDVYTRDYKEETGKLEEVVSRYLVDQFSRLVKGGIKAIDRNKSFMDLGADSTSLISLAQEIEKELGIELYPTLFFEYQNINDLSGYFVEEHRNHLSSHFGINEFVNKKQVVNPANHNKPQEKSRPVSITARPLTANALQRDNAISEEDIAIIGLSGYYPMADTPVKLWENLKAGRNCITEIPEERWDYRPYYDPAGIKEGKAHSKWGGFINSVDRFDPLFFNVSPREAEFMDPQERLFLQVVWEAMEDAGCTRESLKRGRSGIHPKVGVFVGCMYQQYPWLTSNRELGAMLSNNSYWSIANRVSYFFDFQGPSLAVDTACSSSLTALHMACESIRRGECSVAFAGGVNLSLHPYKYLGLSQSKLIGSDERSRSFGDGDGYVPGEGVGAVLLKPLSLAERDRDNIYAVIKGSFANHCGRTNAYKVPNVSSQVDLLVQAMERSGINPETISYVESAANGTSLGDSIEINALSKAFQKYTKTKQFCAVGAVKSNIGHLEAASGISQVTKVALQMKHRMLVPSINAEPSNPNFKFEDTPFFVQKELKKWDRPLRPEGEKKEYPRRAAVNSFGAGGANVHLLLEEYGNTVSEQTDQICGQQIIVLSARNEKRLNAYVKKIVEFLNTTGDEGGPTLADMAYTLQVGREAMEERLAMVVESREELLECLDRYLNQKATGSDRTGIFTGHLNGTGSRVQALTEGSLGEEIINLVVESRDYKRIAALWVEGAKIPWEKIHAENKVCRISMPTYPFEKRRCWIPDVQRWAEPETQNGGRGEKLTAQDMRQGDSTLVIKNSTTGEDSLNDLAGGVPDPEEIIQSEIKQIIKDLLKLTDEDIYMDHDFRKLGFDSIVGTNLIHRLEDTYGVKISPAVLLENNTVRRLASCLVKKEIVLDTIFKARTESNQETCSCVDEGNQPLRFPLSAGQKDLWMVYQMAPDSYAYNVPSACRIAGEVDTEALRRAFKRLVRRHPALRSRIEVLDEDAIQVIDSDVKVSFELENIAHMAESELESYAKAKAREPFDLEKGPLVRLHLFSRSATDHIFLIVLHHIICDGISLFIFLRELTMFYEAEVSGESVTLPPLKATYSDFVNWQAGFLKSGKVLKDKEYWLKRLAGELPVLNLPTDRPRTRGHAFKGDLYTAEIPRKLTEQLKEMSNEVKTYLFPVLMSAFKVLLHRYSQQEEILLGMPVAGRPRTQFEDLIGYFVNMVVIRTNITGGLSFRQLLEDVQSRVLEAVEHGDYPFSELIREMGVHHDSGRPPLFRVAFAFLSWGENADRGSVPANGSLVIEPINGIMQEGEFDLTLEIVEVENGCQMFFKYDPDLFNRETISRMSDHYVNILSIIAAKPKQAVCNIDFLTQEEKKLLLEMWNNTEHHYPEEKCIHHLFEEVARKVPDQVALLHKKDSISYKDLNERANRLASFLINQGVEVETPVGICIERSFDLIIGILGVLKAGGTYVPMDPAYPAERIAYMQSDAKVEVVLTQDNLKEKLTGRGPGRLVFMDTDWKEIEKKSKKTPANNVGPGNLAYIIYTSGSTGQPKGVAIEHKGVVNYLTWCLNKYLSKKDSQAKHGSFAHLPLSFDASVTSLFTPLLGERTLVLASQDGAEIFDDKMVQDGEFDFVKLTPAHLQLLQNCLTGEQLRNFTRLMVVGGEALLYEQVDFLKENDWTVVNEYGPTETVVGSSVFEFPVSQVFSGPVSIGKPIMNTQIYILDKYSNPVPVGVPGELYIGGAGVARGYWQRPDLTAEKFVPNPFSRAPGARMYKTGDLGRWAPDGNIEYLGRIDDQLKIRGYRIELGEIETVLLEYPDIKEAAVVVREDTPGDKRLVACFVAEKDRRVEVESLTSHLKEKTPDYMMPSAVVQMEALPLTSNGKVDRKALSAMDGAVQGERDYVEPRCETEIILAGMWQEILKVEKVGIKDNFFDIGGHSLLAVQLISKMKSRFKKRLPLSELFKNGTIEGLAHLLGDSGESVFSSQYLHGIQPKGNEIPLFMVHGIGGNCLNYADLSRELGGDQPFYGLQSPGLYGECAPLKNVKEMASFYIEQMVKEYREGPYIIGGWSMGSIVAFEMALQLQAKGIEVPLLVLLDTGIWDLKKVGLDAGAMKDIFLKLASEKFRAMLGDIPTWYEPASNDGVEVKLNAVSPEVYSNIRDMLELMIKDWKVKGLLGKDIDRKMAEQLFSGFLANMEATYSYQFNGKYNQEVLCVLAEEEMDNPLRVDEVKFWQQYCARPVIARTTTGNHHTMLLNPCVSSLAEIIQKVIVRFSHERTKHS